MTNQFARNTESIDRERAIVELETISAIWDSDPDRILSMSIGEVKEELREIRHDPNKPIRPETPRLPKAIPCPPNSEPIFPRPYLAMLCSQLRAKPHASAAPSSTTYGASPGLVVAYRASLMLLAETIIFSVVNAPILHDFAFASMEHNALNWLASLTIAALIGLAIVLMIVYHIGGTERPFKEGSPRKVNLNHAGLVAGVLLSLTSAAIWFRNAQGAREVIFAAAFSLVGVAGILSVGWLASALRTSRRHFLLVKEAGLRKAEPFGTRNVPIITDGIEDTMEPTGRFFSTTTMKLLGQTGVGGRARATIGVSLAIALSLMVLHSHYLPPGRQESIEILVDRSFSDREAECWAAPERSIIAADPFNLATVTVLATGDKATGNEPIEVAKYQIADTHRILDGRRAAERHCTEALADAKARYEELPKAQESPIFLGVKRAVEQLQHTDSGSSSVSYLHVLTDGRENVDSSIARALQSLTDRVDGDWKNTLPARIDNKGVQTVFWGIPGPNDATGIGKSNPTIADAQRAEHIRAVWSALFTHPELVTFEASCPDDDTAIGDAGTPDECSPDDEIPLPFRFPRNSVVTFFGM
jgi:hypothetical protein